MPKKTVFLKCCPHFFPLPLTLAILKSKQKWEPLSPVSAGLHVSSRNYQTMWTHQVFSSNLCDYSVPLKFWIYLLLDFLIIFGSANTCKLIHWINKLSVLICDLVKRTEGVLRRISLRWSTLGKFPLSWSVPIFHFGFKIKGAVVILAAGTGESMSRTKWFPHSAETICSNSTKSRL